MLEFLLSESRKGRTSLREKGVGGLCVGWVIEVDLVFLFSAVIKVTVVDAFSYDFYVLSVCCIFSRI